MVSFKQLPLCAGEEKPTEALTGEDIRGQI